MIAAVPSVLSNRGQLEIRREGGCRILGSSALKRGVCGGRVAPKHSRPPTKSVLRRFERRPRRQSFDLKM